MHNQTASSPPAAKARARLYPLSNPMPRPALLSRRELRQIIAEMID